MKTPKKPTVGANRRRLSREDDERANRAVSAYVPKAHKEWLERRAEEDKLTPSEFIAALIEAAYSRDAHVGRAE